MLSFGLSPLDFFFPSPQDFFTKPLATVPRSLTTIGINVTFIFQSFCQFPCKVKVLILLFVFFQFYSVVSRDIKVHNLASFLLFFFFFFFDKVLRSRLGDPFVSQNPRGVCASHSLGQMLGCAYTICQIQISCTVPSGSPFPASRV